MVVTGRVTDAALVVGPALHAFGWGDGTSTPSPGAVVAGHVIECGAQCCGGNYAFFEEMPGRERIGFPIAEVRADGSSVITKHPGTGGAVTVGTVTAQLLYEIGSPRYLSPDAVARFDTIELAQERRGPGAHRRRARRGAAADAQGDGEPRRRLAQLHDARADRARRWPRRRASPRTRCGRGSPAAAARFAETAEDLSGDLTGGGMAYLRLAVRGDDEQAVGRAFSGAVVETSLSSYPGTFFTSAPSVRRAWRATGPPRSRRRR